MKNKITMPLFLFVLLACNQNQNTSKQTMSTPSKSDSLLKEAVTKKDSLSKVLSVHTDTLILKLKMDSANQHVTVPITISSGKDLFATLSSSDKNANIRISQIGLPDSTFDGPFGRQLDYKLKSPGNYKIIIGEDMMAGDRWTGEFVLKAFVK